VAELRTLVAVAVGGMIGAGGRYAVSEAVPSQAGSWPWATLAVNVLGSLAIGILAAHLVRRPVLRAFTATGVLGGFTTFSSFALESERLMSGGRVGMAFAYIAASVVGGVGAARLGLGRSSQAIT
jgi:CrcB protein